MEALIHIKAYSNPQQSDVFMKALGTAKLSLMYVRENTACTRFRVQDLTPYNLCTTRQCKSYLCSMMACTMYMRVKRMSTVPR